MDDYFETRPGVNSARIRRLVLNLLTLGFLLGSAVLGGAYAVILINPQVSFNPYPPPTLPPTVGPPTATNTPAIYLPTEIPATPTPPARPLPTAPPTGTPIPTATTAETQEVTPSGTLEATTPPPTVQAGAQFELQPGSPTHTAHVQGCSVMGVGGRVFDLQSAPIIGLAVRMGGTLGGVDIGTLDSLTGSATALFGFGGYYFDLGSTPIASEGTLWIQVLDASSGLPLSEQIPLTTYASCDQNLVLVNFRQVGQ
jgi:hypothetical protein